MKLVLSPTMPPTIALVGLIAGGGATAGGLLLLSPLPLGSLWALWVSCLALVSAAWLAIARTGRALNARFEAVVAEFIDGRRDQLVWDDWALRQYNALVLALLLFALVVLAFSVFTTLMAVVGAGQLMEYIRSSTLLPFVFMLAVVGLVSGVAVVRAVLRMLFPFRAEQRGLEIARLEQPRLWALSEEVARAAQANPASVIAVTPDAVIGVAQSGSLLSVLRGREHGVLTIGMVALHQMTVGELRTVLCHEYGHFSHGHTRWGPFDRALGSAFHTALRTMPGPRRWRWDSFDWIVWLYRTMAALNPAYWLLDAVVKLHYRIVAAFRRMGEVQADLTALRLGGPDAFESSLVRSAVNARAFHQLLEPAYVQQMYNQGWILHRFSAICGDRLNVLDDAVMQRFVSEAQATMAPQSEFDSHPPVATRLKYARRFVSAAATDDRPVQVLFDNWDSLDERLAAAYHADLPGSSGGRDTRISY